MWEEGRNWRLWRGKFQEAMQTVPDDFYDCCFTDPPFAQETHEGALTTKGDDDEAILIDFDSLTSDEMREHMEVLAPKVNRWFVATMEWRHISDLERHEPKGWRFVRFGLWIKPSYKPQVSGDRPATGWEAVGIFHRDRGPGFPRRMHWNGGGKNAIYTGNKSNDAQYPTQKPLWLPQGFIRDFSDKGGRIIDPYGGSGTTGVAALLRRHPVDVCEVRPKGQDITLGRLRDCQPEGTEAVLLKQGSLFG